ncbi:MAG: quinone-dependent dihydroorotate dehydrogenase [Bdellovibrionaceae bacterium]|nr:quinone-dependent dihydroorotate dehydrogenase [Pseudobdellovibrionaceae bacterium]
MLTKPWLLLPSHWLYSLSPIVLKFYSHINSDQPYKWKTVKWRNLSFPNPLGIAGGLDKNATYIKDYWKLGAGFVEVGTVTPKAQHSNPHKILDRSVKHLSLWNNMGFPNRGLDFVKNRLEILFEESNEGKKILSPIFINIGKNRDTPISQAVEDYKKSMEALYPFASAFVINISSPNTKDLRELFKEKNLYHFLNTLHELRLSLKINRPLILKLSPDEDNFMQIIEQSLSVGIDGWCICNSTIKRPVKNIFPEDRGGLSGRLLGETSLGLLKQLKAYLEKNQIKDKLVISCGGVLTAQDVLERLNLGADLVQVYSALVFKGFGFFKSVYKELA